ncbi:MAG: hypothetical protein ACXACH_05060 [Candidatus Hermodarchaeia archaeon]|jgi:hypothetical protein
MSKSKDKWTAIGMTAHTKARFVAMKKAYQKSLGMGPQTWDNFLNALLDLGPLTWNFLIKESVKGVQASMQPCPFPRTKTGQTKGTPST